MICPSELTRGEGYVIDSIAHVYGEFIPAPSEDIAHLRHNSMKDTMWVKFKKKMPQKLQRENIEIIIEFDALYFVS